MSPACKHVKSINPLKSNCILAFGIIMAFAISSRYRPIGKVILVSLDQDRAWFCSALNGLIFAAC